MVVLFFTAALAVFFIVLPAARALPFAATEDGFIFPTSLFEFPDQFSSIPFNGKNNLTLEEGKSDLSAYFAIPLNESDLAHEIHIISNKESPHKLIHHEFQSLKLFSNSQSEFYWEATDLNYYERSCNIYVVELHSDNIKIKFYTNGNAIFGSGHKCKIPIQYNYTHGNYFFIPFSINWNNAFESFTLEMGNGIKLAFYEGQYEDPPKEMEWPLLELSTTTTTTTTSMTTSTTTEIPSTTSSSTSTTSTTTTKIPTTSFLHPEFDFSIFIKQNFDLLIIIAILCFLILFCSMAAIFLCCFFKSK